MIEAGSASESSAIGLSSTPQTMVNVQRSILTMEPELENLARDRLQWPFLQYQITRTIRVTHGYR